MPWVCLRFVIVVFPDHTHLIFLPDETSLKDLKEFNARDIEIVSRKYSVKKKAWLINIVIARQ